MSKKKNTATAPTAPAAPVPETAAPAPEHGSVLVPVLRKPANRALWAALGDNPGSTTAALAETAGIGVSTARRLLMGWETAGAARSATDPASPRAGKTWTAGSAASVVVEPEPAAPEPATPDPAAPEPVNPQPGPAVPAAPEPVTRETDSAEPDSAEPAPAEPGAVEPAAPESVSLEPAIADPADPAPETAVAAPTGDDPTDPAPVAPAPVAEPAAANAESTVERLPAGALRGQVEDYLRDNPGKEFSPHQIGKALERSSGAVHNALVKLTKDGTARQTATAPKKFTLAS